MHKIEKVFIGFLGLEYKIRFTFVSSLKAQELLFQAYGMIWLLQGLQPFNY